MTTEVVPALAPMVKVVGCGMVMGSAKIPFPLPSITITAPTSPKWAATRSGTPSLFRSPTATS